MQVICVYSGWARKSKSLAMSTKHNVYHLGLPVEEVPKAIRSSNTHTLSNPQEEIAQRNVLTNFVFNEVV